MYQYVNTYTKSLYTMNYVRRAYAMGRKDAD